MSIKKLPTSERPYEKAQLYGLESLSNSELLAIIIKTGTKEKTSVELAQQILSIEAKRKHDLQFLQNISIEELTKIKGIGKVKAIQIKAVCELTKRMSRPMDNTTIKIFTPASVANLLMDEMRFEKQEKLKVLILNSKRTLLKIIDVSYGGINSAAVEPREVLAEPVKMGAYAIIMVHNHPSGDPTPSEADIKITKDIYKSAKLLGIRLIDHIILAGNQYKGIISSGRMRNKK